MIHDLAEDCTECESLEDGVLEGGVEVYGVVMTAALAADVYHSCASKVADQAPYRALCEGHLRGNLADGATGMDRDVEEDRAVAGDEIPVAVHCDAVATHYQT